MDQRLTRRSFVRLGGAGAAAVTLGGLGTSRALAQVRFGDYPFALGVASGDPTPRGAVLWTRLATDALGEEALPPRPIPVRWELSTDDGFRRLARRGRVLARPEDAHSVHVELDGLDSAREYFYRFIVGDEVSPVGRTRTAPARFASPKELRFAFVSCQQYEHGYFTAYRRMVETEDLDFVVHLGDYIYEYGTDEYLSPTGNVRHHVGDEIVSLEDYRRRYAQYHADEDLQAAHAAFPFIVTWDDHETENNYAGLIPERDQDPVAFVARRANAYKAYYENMPLRRSSLPSGPDLNLYRWLAFGDLAEMVVLDTRQYRSDQACGDGARQPCPEWGDPSRTLLGGEQEAEVLGRLGRSQGRWNIVAQQVFMAQRDFLAGEGVTLSMDAWDGYPAARDRFLGGVAQRRVRNPIVLTGDVHANWAADLKADFAEPDSATIGSEFVCTSITSGGNGSEVAANTPTVLAENPHIRYYNNRRGYVRCALSREEWRTDYRVLPYVTRPDAPVETRASFVVESGRPGIQPA